MLTQVDEITGNSPLDLSEDVIGHADAAGVGDAFNAGSNVHAIPEDVTAIDDDVADVDADAEVNPRFRRHPGIASGHALLDIDRTTHGIHSAAEFSQHPVSGVLDDPPTILRDLRIHDGRKVFPELDVRPLFVQAGQAAVPCHVGCQNRREPPFQVL